MKNRLLALFVAVICLVMPVLTSCSDEEAEVKLGTKAVTVTLYGIKGEGTTDEAIKAVEDRLNGFIDGYKNMIGACFTCFIISTSIIVFKDKKRRKLK